MDEREQVDDVFQPLSDYPLLCALNLEGRKLKDFSLSELTELAAEIRSSLIKIVKKYGGHMASNLGVVELSIAMHYVFESPRDAFFWDVGHQAYCHKMLTGRWLEFSSLRQYNGLSGFPRREESKHDFLNSGHAATAISAGLGMELGKNPEQQNNKVLAVVGDASLTAGMTFEAMNHGGHVPNSLVVILNDNEMSISPNVGALSRILSRMSSGHSYVFIRDHINQAILNTPLIGKRLYQSLLALKGIIKKAVLRINLFSELGYKYIGPVNGHNLPLLIDTMHRIKQLQEPVLLHVCTQKGKGLKEAEEKPSEFHGLSPAKAALASSERPSLAIPTEESPKFPDKNTENSSTKPDKAAKISFTQAFTQGFMQVEGSCDKLACISAAMTQSTGLKEFAQQHPTRFFDVGIAEQHAVTLAAGLAMAGKIPLVAIYSTFMQRALDQLIHDISLMRIPAIFVCDRAGIVPGDGETHQGIYDIVQFRSILHLSLYSPSTREELWASLKAVVEEGAREMRAQEEGQHAFKSEPSVLRLPKRNCPSQKEISSGLELSYLSTEDGQFVPLQGCLYHSPSTEAQTLLICSGPLLPEALQVLRSLASRNCAVDVFSLNRLKPLASKALYQLMQGYSHVFCIEDGVEAGGIGQELLSLFWQQRQEIGISHTASPQLPQLYFRGVRNEPPNLGSYEQLLGDYQLSPEALERWILSKTET